MSLTKQIATVPSILFYLAAILGSLGSAQVHAAEPIDLGTRRELMVDDFLFDKIEGGASLRMHHPVPHDVAINHDAPWEGSGSGYHAIFKDGDKYRMYYKSWQISVIKPRPSGDQRIFICYAESKDGIHWTKPNLGLHEFNGSRNNNIMMAEIDGGSTHDFSPFVDANPNALPSEKYKAVGRGGGQGWLYAFKSADGIHWTAYNDEKPVMTEHPFDTQNIAFWDPNIGKYRAYIREFYAASADSSRRRGIKTATSDDLVNWSERQWLDFGDAPKAQMYTNQVKPYFRAPHFYIGFPARYLDRGKGKSYEQLAGWDERKNRDGRYGTAVTDGLLMTSRDGLHFKRWGEAFLRPGLRANNWSYGDNYIAWHVVETVSDAPGNPPELSLYATEDYFTGHDSKLRRYTLRMDGFVSLNAPQSGGSILTKPITFDGDSLTINYATSAAGSIRIALQNADGTPIPGFSLNECDDIFGDQLNRVVTWQGMNDLSDLAGKPLRMSVQLSDADLYSFQFADVSADHASDADSVFATSTLATDKETIQSMLKDKEPKTWVMTGDSITHGASHTKGARSYPEHVAERVRWELRRTRDVIINTGISGHRTTNLLNDFDWRIGRYQPDIVSIMIGTNDCVAKEQGLSNYRADLLELVKRIRDLGAVPILQTANPADPEHPSNREWLPQYMDVMRAVAKAQNVILVDQYAYWEEHCANREAMLAWLNDPIHPNGVGHLMFAQEMFRELGIFDANAPTCKTLSDSDYILATTAKPGQAIEAALLLPPSKENARNSEGDFIKLKDGRVMFVYTHFYGGGSDHAAAKLAARFSSDGGRTWTETDELILENEGGMNVMSVSLLRLDNGRIALFYLRKNSTTNNRPILRYSDDEGKTWSAPVEIISDKENGYYVLNNDRVIQTKAGRLIAPVAQHNGFGMEEHGKWTGNGLISCYLSDDAGKTWRRSKKPFYVQNPEGKTIASQEPGVVELNDGRLMMFIRTDANHPYQCFSDDGGETWSKPEPMAVHSPLSPTSIERIPSTGDLLMVWNNNTQTGGPRPRLRTPFNTAVSTDQGKTWSDPKTLFDDPKGWYCYTAIHFEGDRVLLGHCAGGEGQGGMGLSVTQVTSVPIKWLYQE